MELGDILRFTLALVFVLGLILLLGWLARRFQLGGPSAGGAGSRLAIVEVRALDPRRRLVLVRRDDIEHLLLVAQDGSVVIESGIRPGEHAGARRPAITAGQERDG